jgi:class 3 adenylate cyclase
MIFVSWMASLRSIPSLSLRNKIYILSVGLVVVLIAAVLGIVDRQIERQTTEKIGTDFLSTYQNFDRFLKLRNRRLQESCLLISELPVLKAQLSTKDPATIKDYILHQEESPARVVQVDILTLTDDHGRVLFRLDEPDKFGDTLSSLPSVRHALEGKIPAPDEITTWVNDDRLYQIATVPIVLQSYVIGTLTLGERLTQNEVELIKQDTKSEITFILNNKIVASTLPDIRQLDLLRAYLLDRAPIDKEIKQTDNIQKEITLDGERYLCAFAQVSKSGDAIYVMAFSMDKALASLHAVEKVILIVGLLALVLALASGYFLAKGITAPVQRLVEAMEGIRGGNYELQIPLSSDDEIGRLGRSFNEMVSGLRERLLMSKFVSSSTVEMIRQEGGKLHLGGERRNVTVFFSDIRGFTAYSEQVQPEVVIDLLNKYLSLQAGHILAHHGIIDKYVGDEVVAIFEGPDMADNAILAAIGIQKDVAKLNLESQRSIMVGIGINTGMAIVGNVGSEERMDHTVLGNNMNLGARLCSIAQPGQIIVSESSWRLAKSKEIVAKPLDTITAKGISRPVQIYEVAYSEPKADTTNRSG